MTLTDQLYYVTDVLGSYDPPTPFTSSSADCQADLVYTNVVTTHTWITDNSGTGKALSWQTDDETQVVTYTVTITGSPSASCPGSKTTSYDLDVQSACNVLTPTIDVATSIFASPAMS